MTTELMIPTTEFKTEFVQGGVKAAIAENKIKTRDLLMVPLENIHVVANLNVRIHDEEYEARVEEIKESIKANGFYLNEPLAGYVGKEGEQTLIYCTGGFTRLEAARRAAKEGAPLEALPVVLKPPGTSMVDLIVALDVDNNTKRLKPYERAIVVKRLTDFNVEEESIATKLRVTTQYVKDLLYLMSLPNALRMIVVKGIASSGHVVQLARKVGPAEALRAFEAQAPGTTEAEGETDPLATGTKVSPRHTAGASGTKIIVPKKTLFSAIDYAIALPTEGIDWLSRWRKGDDEAVQELSAYKPPRKARSDKKPKATGTGKKPGRPKKNADPLFDTTKKKKTKAKPAGDDAPL